MERDCLRGSISLGGGLGEDSENALELDRCGGRTAL